MKRSHRAIIGVVALSFPIFFSFQNATRYGKGAVYPAARPTYAKLKRRPVVVKNYYSSSYQSQKSLPPPASSTCGGVDPANCMIIKSGQLLENMSKYSDLQIRDQWEELMSLAEEVGPDHFLAGFVYSVPFLVLIDLVDAERATFIDQNFVDGIRNRRLPSPYNLCNQISPNPLQNTQSEEVGGDLIYVTLAAQFKIYTQPALVNELSKAMGRCYGKVLLSSNSNYYGPKNIIPINQNESILFNHNFENPFYGFAVLNTLAIASGVDTVFSGGRGSPDQEAQKIFNWLKVKSNNFSKWASECISNGTGQVMENQVRDLYESSKTNLNGVPRAGFQNCGDPVLYGEAYPVCYMSNLDVFFKTNLPQCSSQVINNIRNYPRHYYAYNTFYSHWGRDFLLRGKIPKLTTLDGLIINPAVIPGADEGEGLSLQWIKHGELFSNEWAGGLVLAGYAPNAARGGGLKITWRDLNTGLEKVNFTPIGDDLKRTYYGALKPTDRTHDYEVTVSLGNTQKSCVIRASAVPETTICRELGQGG